MVLEGIRVLDLSRYVAGPYCGALLADMGAEVIKIERPGGGDERMVGPFAPNGEAMSFYMNLSRNKKGITLNLMGEKGREILRELVKRSDVVLENFTPAAAEAMGLDYQSLKELNPGIILVSVSGFGKYGPYSQRTCFDSIAQAMSGAMSYTGFPDGPPMRAAVPYVDFSAATNAALGTMFALFHRQRTGVGQMVDVALLDTAVAFVAGMGVAAEYQVLGQVRGPIGNHSFYNATDCFRAKDGWVMVSIIGNSLWRRFLGVIGREELASDPRFKDDMSRYQNRALINPIVSQWMAEKTVDEVIRLLEEARVPCGPVNTIAEVVADPQVKAREMLVDVEYPDVGEVPVGGVVIKLSETPGKIRKRGPRVGENNDEVYRGLLGLSPEELERLKAEGVI